MLRAPNNTAKIKVEIHNQRKDQSDNHESTTKWRKQNLGRSPKRIPQDHSREHIGWKRNKIQPNGVMAKHFWTQGIAGQTKHPPCIIPSNMINISYISITSYNDYYHTCTSTHTEWWCTKYLLFTNGTKTVVTNIEVEGIKPHLPLLSTYMLSVYSVLCISASWILLNIKFVYLKFIFSQVLSQYPTL